MSVRTLFLACVLSALSLPGCSTGGGQAFLVKPAFQETPRAPLEQPLLLLPVQVTAFEIDAGGGAHAQPEAAKALAEAIADETRSVADRAPWLTILDLPEVNDDQSAVLEQNLLLLNVVAMTAAGAHLSRDEAWNAVAANLDYSIGPGLFFLSERTGVRRALLITGGRATSSGGRTAVSALAAVLPSLVVPGMIFVPLGPFASSNLVAAVIDLHTGDVLWLHPGDGRYARQIDMTSENGARRTISAMLGMPRPREYEQGDLN